MFAKQILGAVAVLVAVTACGTGGPLGPTASAGMGQNLAFEDQVLALLNQRRATGATCGGVTLPPVGPLVMDQSLRAAAQQHSADMAASGTLSHVSSDGRTFDQRIMGAGYTGSLPLGENVAVGQPTPQSVLDAWLASPNHCTTLMAPNFKATGVGYAVAKSKPYWAQSFGG